MIIQTYNPQHPVILETKDYDHATFYQRELTERKRFAYPPFFRMIKLTIKHKRPEVAEETAMLFAKKLKAKLGNRVIGPSTPGISRIRGFYIQDIIIKLEKKKQVIIKVKELIRSIKSEISQLEGRKTVRIIANIDP